MNLNFYNFVVIDGENLLRYFKMLWKSTAVTLSLLSSISSSPIYNKRENSTPTVQIQNGTITGKYLDGFNQDAYLGIPFAEPPINELRFQPPQTYNNHWNDTQNFTEYGFACFASSGLDSRKLPQSEDCLTLNIVKPHNIPQNESLPVGIWIHGGGFTDGSGTRPAYNTSWIVENSVSIDKPIIAITINYRLNGFGFLSSDQVSQKGWTNNGLRDQIKAIEWVHENIAGFGGDPNHIVIWGESAGAISVGKLLNNDKYLGSYLKGGIMESGSNVFTNILPASTEQNEDDFTKLLQHFQCDQAIDYLECLQKIDSKSLQNAFNTTNGILTKGWGFPYIDGDVITGSGYDVLQSGEGFHKVPILIGTNTDEGSAFVNKTLNTTEQTENYLQKSFPHLSDNSTSKLIELYNGNNSQLVTPQDPTYNNTPITYPPYLGSTYPRLATLNGDLMFIAGSKFTAKLYAENDLPVFKYRFNIPTLETSNSTYLGSTHYQEVVYVFDNQQHPTDGSDGTNVYPSEDASKISDAISKIWVSFIHDLDPNISNGDHKDGGNFQIDVPNWPDYRDGSENYVFDLKGFHIEQDDFRKEQFEYIESIIHQLDG
ncbi:Acetylcholinesterase [Wickerhamomyces ciferrii]|uniref:Carboxylic ester hydrolase n=1 Tax=Wickerhamomyces ciferrii (strain ATCC 14091 / BCRC 22168 / CBS 111 / JCM 3599 / NBRC 0793 / NRRL Y-1031 F-60-10) TaxID=1206466 RepID=K0KRQ2_WICCF|nr:Acetylcholinesterase [Wickerhamomyces ciferrii]CCH44004.1 Acetylcholinesterase [Wickerhamomyces ciferrii]